MLRTFGAHSKWWGGIALPVLAVSACLLTVTQFAHGALPSDYPLQVYDKQHRFAIALKSPFRRVGAGQFVFSKLEFHNRDEEVTLTIFDVDFLDIQRFELVRDIRDVDLNSEPPLDLDLADSGDVEEEQLIHDEIPSQLFVTRLDEPVRMTPGQKGILSINFFPRWPSSENFLDKSRMPHGKCLPVTLSFIERADLAYLVGEEALWYARHRHATLHIRHVSNHHSLLHQDLNERFTISASVYIDHSKGRSVFPLFAEAYRYNFFGLPPRIQFLPEYPQVFSDALDDSQAILSDILEVGKKTSRHAILQTDKERKYAPPTKKARLDRDCVDIHISNPMDFGGYWIEDVTVSAPDVVSLIYRPDKDADFIDRPMTRLAEWPFDDPGELSQGLYLNERTSQVYLASVCSFPLNDLQFTGEHDELINTTFSDDLPLIPNVGPMGYVQVKTESDTIFIMLEPHQEEMEDFPDSMVGLGSRISHEYGNATSAKLRLITEDATGDLQFFLWASDNMDAENDGNSAIQSFTLQNHEDVPIKVMQVSLGLFDHKFDRNLSGDYLFNEGLAEVGLEVKLSVAGGCDCDSELNMSAPECCFLEEREPEGILYPQSTGDSNATSVSYGVSVSINPEMAAAYIFKETEDIKRLHFKGRIIVRATRQTGMSFNQWKRYMQNDPYHDMDLTVSVPLSITVVHSKVVFLLDPPTSELREALHQTFVFQERSINERISVAQIFFPSSHVLFQSLWADFHRSQGPFPPEFRNGFSFRLSVAVTHPDPKASRPTSLGVMGHNDSDDAWCKKVFQSGILEVETERPSVSKASNQFKVGEVFVSYSFPKEKMEHAVECVLDVKFAEKRLHGKLSLHVFSGKVDVTDSDTKLKRTESYVSSGLADLANWTKLSAAGRALVRFLEMEWPDREEPDRTVLESYMNGLAFRSFVDDSQTLTPVLVNAGAVALAERSHVYLFFQNNNPVTLKLFLDVSHVEGARIVVDGDARIDGKVGLLEGLPESAPYHTKSGLRILLSETGVDSSWDSMKSFLIESPLVRDVFGELFPIRDAVYEKRGKRRLDRRLHTRKGHTRFHSDEGRTKADLCWSEPEQQIKRPLRAPSPLLLSDDLTIQYQSKLCYPSLGMNASAIRESSQHVSIPPNSEARFRIVFRAPQSVSRDINHFVSTGLVLRTSLGEVLPLFLTYETVLGHLAISKQDRYHEEAKTVIQSETIEVIDVPMGLYYSINGSRRSENLEQDSTPIYMQSTFDREVRLHDIRSCNPWFSVDLVSSSLTIERSNREKSHIGQVRSSVSCPIHNDQCSSVPGTECPDEGRLSTSTIEFPSFYTCVITWLDNRNGLQPHGCGLSDSDEKRSLNDFDGENDAIKRAMRASAAALALATVAFSDQSARMRSPESDLEVPSPAPSFAGYDAPLHDDSLVQRKTSRRGRAVMDTIVLQTFAEALDAWRAVADLGLNKVSTSLTATISYDTEADVRDNETLSVSFEDTVLRTSLEIPKLFDVEKLRGNGAAAAAEPYLEFPDTVVAKMSAVMLPVKNPSLVPVRIHLSAAPYDPFATDYLRRQSPGESYEVVVPGILDGNGPIYTQVHPNVENHNSSSWWDGQAGFFMIDDYANLIRSTNNMTFRAAGSTSGQVTSVNPSVHSTSAFLVGCGRRCCLPPESGNPEHTSWTSPIGASAAAGIALSGRPRTLGTASGDEPTIPPGGSVLESRRIAPFSIPFSAFDEIILPPNSTGHLGPIYFRPPGEYSMFGCQTILKDQLPWGRQSDRLCSSHPFQSLVMLENSLTGLERVKLRAKGKVHRVVFVDPDPNVFGSLEYRFGRSALVFSGGSMARNQNDSSAIEKRQFFITNTGDIDADFESAYLAPSRSGDSGSTCTGCMCEGFRIIECSDSEDSTVSIGHKRVSNVRLGFQLAAGNSLLLTIEHTPDCTVQTRYVSFRVKYRKDTAPKPGEQIVMSRGTAMRQRRASSKSFNLGRSEEVLLIGYDDKPDCGWKQRHRFFDDLNLMQLFFLLCLGLSCLAMTFLGLRRRLTFRAKLAKEFGSVIKGISRSKSKTTRYMNWPATFRCLARTDPSASELRALGMEQIRHVVLQQFKEMGSLLPQCIDGTGMFLRDRSSVSSRTDDRKIRPLSDSIFSRYDQQCDRLVLSLMPCALGWKAALALGALSGADVDARSEMLSSRLRRKRDEGGSKKESKQTSRKSRPEIMDVHSPHNDGDASTEFEENSMAAGSIGESIVSKGEDSKSSRQSSSRGRLAKLPTSKQEEAKKTGKTRKSKSRSTKVEMGSKGVSKTIASVATEDGQIEKEGSVARDDKEHKKKESASSFSHQVSDLERIHTRAIHDDASHATLKRNMDSEVSNERSALPGGRGVAPPPGFGAVPARGTLPDSQVTPGNEKRTQDLLMELPTGNDEEELQPSNESLSLLAGLEASLSNINTIEPAASAETALGQLYGASASSLAQGSISADNQSQTSLFGGPLLLRKNETEAPISNLLPMHAPVPAASSVGGAFNVMAFLDNILEEPRRDAPDESSFREIPVLTNLRAEAQVHDTATAAALPTNPWAAAASRGISESRASRFGIALEVDMEDDPVLSVDIEVTPSTSHTEERSIPVVPLLSPSAIITEGEEEKDEKQLANLRGSFYSQLLGESHTRSQDMT